MRPYEYLDRTGDLGSRVQSGALQDLFTNAARPLFETIALLDILLMT